jgi:predicted RecB family nuclease
VPHNEHPAYIPVIAKNNEVVESAVTRRARRSTLSNFDPDLAEVVPGVGIRRNDTMARNVMSLCHALRILETFGLGDAHQRGGVVDRRGQLWWVDLAGPDVPRGGLRTYDPAHELRREVLDAHDQWAKGEGEFPTLPYWHRECPSCPFRDRCSSELEATDDVSLVRFTSQSEQLLLREHGIATRTRLAQLDPALAASARGRLLAPGAVHEPELHLGRVIDKLDDLIFRARSSVAGAPLRKVPVTEMGCPTADLEIDVDMESYKDHTYLWGATVRCSVDVPGVLDGYHPFVCWDGLDLQSEARLFAEFFSWLEDQRHCAEAVGASFRAYCFWARAEDGAMDRALAAGVVGGPTTEALARFRHPDQGRWVDLHELVRRQIQTDGPLGLKSLAGAAGFTWRDENPSGEASMLWYEEAAGPEGSDAARRRLLEYNEDDCRATAALRRWLNGAAQELPSRDDPPGDTTSPT